ncbi:MAG TPA: metallopeptidase family protein [Tepidisphaeraceae bacterium]|nr:metallopeptidase family protein [Tepidisphaeraceae bacterium]
MPYQVSKSEFGELVERALAELPEEFAEFLEEVPIEIRDHPTRQQMRSVNVPSDTGLLLGLYVGRPRTQRSVEHSGSMPDIIYIFQRPIETVSENEDQLIRQVRTTVLHEIGHHFGMTEEDLRRLGYG